MARYSGLIDIVLVAERCCCDAEGQRDYASCVVVVNKVRLNRDVTQCGKSHKIRDGHNTMDPLPSRTRGICITIHPRGWTRRSGTAVTYSKSYLAVIVHRRHHRWTTTKYIRRSDWISINIELLPRSARSSVLLCPSVHQSIGVH